MDKNNFKLDFIGIGAPKCATTWIYECLAEHPQICMSRPKEANLFSQGPIDRESLEKCFKHCQVNQIKGEFSPGYLIKDKIAQRMREHNPAIKLIVSLKNPIKRAHSHYLQGLSLQNKDWESFSDALQKEPEIINYSFYYKNLLKFLRLFPREQFLVLIVEDIKKDPTAFIRQIYSFLEVDSSFEPKKAKIKVSPTAFKLTKFGKLVHKLFGQPLGRFEIGRRIKRYPIVRKNYLKFAEFYALKKGKKPEMDKKIREKLYNIYQDDINNLERLIGRDLSHWK